MVVGGVVDVAPAPWPEAPTVPGLPVLVESAAPLPVAPCAPLWPLLVLPVELLPVELPPVELPPVELPPVVPLAVEPPDVEPVAELLPESLPLMPIALHAAKDNTVMLLMRMPWILFMVIS